MHRVVHHVRQSLDFTHLGKTGGCRCNENFGLFERRGDFVIDLLALINGREKDGATGGGGGSGAGMESRGGLFSVSWRSKSRRFKRSCVF